MKIFINIFSFALVILIGIVDYRTGHNISFMFFYLFPISLVAWHSGLRLGIIISVISGIIWLWADLAAGHPYAYFFTPLWNMFVRIIFFLSPVFFIEMHKAYKHEKDESKKDYLTGILNRKGFIENISIEIERNRRYGRAFTAILLDCDDFKYINDHYGHDAGDCVLRLVANTLASVTRATDIIARIGGDEFFVCLSETDLEQSKKMIERFRKKLLQVMKECKWPMTCSMGAVTYRKPPPTSEDLMKKCDLLLYSAKEKNKGSLLHEIFE